MKLFGRGKGGPGDRAAQPPAFQPIDRANLLGLLDQIVNTGQTGVLELMEPRGSWVYAFQGGALTHASGGRVRGARQAFDLLWEFQQGEFMFTTEAPTGLNSNLYIDKARLLEMLHRSQAVLQTPASPYIPAEQQRNIVRFPTPTLGQPPAYQPPAPYPQPYAGAPAQQPQYVPPQAAPQYPPQYAQPQAQPPQYAPQAAPPQYAQPPAAPPQYAPPPAAPPQYAQPLAPPPQYSQPQAAPPQYAAPQPPAPPLPVQRAQPPMPPVVAPQAAAPVAPAAPPAKQASPRFSVPPMPFGKKAAKPVEAQAPTPAPAPAAAHAPAPEPAKPVPLDDLRALRASLAAQAPAVPAGSKPPSWGVRAADGKVLSPGPALKGGQNGKKAKKKRKSPLGDALKIQTIKFLLWACERKYSPEDHWTLKDAFEVSTMELREQFVGAFSQTLKPPSGSRSSADDDDQLSAGRMRGRARAKKR